jgi:uncharacterized protein YhbP (UPF0306 family)
VSTSSKHVVRPSLSELHAFLKKHTTLSLATIGPEGQPQVADLYYTQTPDLKLYFVSSNDSRHVHNITRDDRVAGTVHAVSSRWRDIHGMQLEGVCAPVPKADKAVAWARYLAKYPFVMCDPILMSLLRKVSLYCLVPRWIRWIDNNVNIGHNVEYWHEV